MKKYIAMVAAALFISIPFLTAQAEPVSMDIQISNTHIHKNRTQTVYALINFDTEDISANRLKQRSPVDLSLVIDRSGSMNERGKLTYAKQASIKLVDLLSRHDGFSLVQYDDSVSTMWPHAKMRSPHMIKNIIRSLQPGGSTNLAGGMQQGVNELLNFERMGSTKRVILMSDGLVNHGITNPYTIAQMASEARRKGIAISTMGLGLNYDENLMQSIAEAGGGQYYYIESPSQISSIFQQEMDVLFTMMTDDIRYIFKHGKNVADVKVYGYKYNSTPKETVIHMNNFHAAEKRTVLLEITLKPVKSSSTHLGTFKLTYKNRATNSRIKQSIPYSISTTTSKSVLSRNENRTVSAEAAIVNADEQHEEAVKLYEKGDIKGAKQKINSLNSFLAIRNKELKDTRVSKKMEALSMEADEMEQAAASPAMTKSYLKQRKHDMYKAQKGARNSYMLEPGTTGSKVKSLQQKLSNLKLYRGTISGIYDTATKTAVKTYQQQNGLTPDGIAGAKTLKMLGLYK